MLKFVMVLWLIAIGDTTKPTIAVRDGLSKGEVFYVKVTESTSCYVSSEGKQIQRADLKKVAIYRVGVISTDKEGGKKIEIIYDSMYHGESDGSIKPSLDETKEMRGHKIHIYIDKNKKVMKVEIPDVENQKNQRIDSEEAANLISTNVLNVILLSKVSEKEKWVDERKYPLSDGMKKTQAEYKLNKIDGDILYITGEIAHEWSYTTPDGKAKDKPQLAYDLIKGSGGSREIEYNNKLGRIVKMKDSYSMSGDIVRTVGGMGKQYRITHDSVHVYMTSDKLPTVDD